ncbi:hypothetical protein ONE63_002844 [Megalurothrips usitatus]|uniref:Uncharacterized protein n=1 Tax=Megalurothrips usitatus TaxID=439358 RepID=A0AAV7X959_9NEOP|nr:hypothetical protein ONE63_002844 [Megalurothrips usitatus]
MEGVGSPPDSPAPDLDYGLDVVVAGSQRLLQSLADEQAGVNKGRARVAALRQRLAEQVEATEAAQRLRLAARVRLLQAGRAVAVARARGGLPAAAPGRRPRPAESGVLVRDREDGAGPQALQAARKHRDAARAAALQLMTRVRLLRDAADAADARQASLRASAACSGLVLRASADLDRLAEQHRSLARSAAAAVDVPAARDPRDQLEERWTTLTRNREACRLPSSAVSGRKRGLFIVGVTMFLKK